MLTFYQTLLLHINCIRPRGSLTIGACSKGTTAVFDRLGLLLRATPNHPPFIFWITIHSSLSDASCRVARQLRRPVSKGANLLKYQQINSSPLIWVGIVFYTQTPLGVFLQVAPHVNKHTKTTSLLCLLLERQRQQSSLVTLNLQTNAVNSAVALIREDSLIPAAGEPNQSHASR